MSSLSDTVVGDRLEQRVETILSGSESETASADAASTDTAETAGTVPDDTPVRVIAQAGEDELSAVEAAARRHGRVNFVFPEQSLVAATLPADEVAAFAATDAVTAIDVDGRVELSRADPPRDAPPRADPPRDAPPRADPPRDAPPTAQAANTSNPTARTAVARSGIDSWGFERIDADLVHEAGINGSGVRVAVLDTGIDPSAGMQGKIVAERDFAPNSQFDGDDPTDHDGHGTNVAGIVAANETVVDPPGDTQKRVHGVAPGVSVLNGKISSYVDELRTEPTADQTVTGLRDGETVTRPLSVPNDGRWLRAQASWDDPDNDVRIQLVDSDGDVLQTLTDYNRISQPVETARDGARRTRIEVNGTTDIYAEPVAGIRVTGVDVDGTADVELDVEMWTGGPAFFSDMAAAINWAAGNGGGQRPGEPADVISLSYGTGDDTITNPVPGAMDNAVDDGVVFVTSGGNAGQVVVEESKRKRNIITVGASNRNDDRTSFSQVGDAANGTYKPDVLAPGDDIPSAGPTERIPRVDGSYNGTVVSGTSQATPHVSGVAALYIQMYQRVHGEQPTPKQVRAALVAGTQRPNVAGEPVDTTYSDASGLGVVDAYATLLTFTETGRTTGETDEFTVTTPGVLPADRLASVSESPLVTGSVYYRDQGDPVRVQLNGTAADNYGPFAVAETAASPGGTYSFNVTHAGSGGERYALATHYPPVGQQFEGERLEGYSFRSPVTLDAGESAVYAVPVNETVGGTFIGNRGGVRAISYANESGADVDIRVALSRGPTVNATVDTPVVNTEQAVSRRPADGATVTFTAGDTGTAEFAHAANYPLLPLPSRVSLSGGGVTAGNASQPTPVAVELSVEAAGQPYTERLNASQFRVRVNGTTVSPNQTAVTPLSSGEYRVGFLPPRQPNAGSYELSVAVTDTRAGVSHTATAVDEDGVEYTSGGTTAGRAALALVIDRSGSMGYDPDKIKNAKEAGEETVALLNDREYAAVVGFNHDTRTPVPLSRVAGNRSQMRTGIDGFVADGRTRIGAALSTARTTLTRAPNGTSEAVLLLTDGRDGGNVDPVQIASDLGDDGTPVYTVALGGDADGQLLAEIADASGGGATNESDPAALADIFADIRGQVSGTSVVKSTAGTVNASANVSRRVPVDASTDTTSIRVQTTKQTGSSSTTSTSADTAGADTAGADTASADTVATPTTASLPSGQWPRVELYYPNGTVVPYASTGQGGVTVADPDISLSDVDGTIIYRINDPEAGNWSYRIDNDAPDTALRYQADVRASTATTLDVVTGGSEFVNGTDTRVVATVLGRDGGVSGLDANATVSLPDGETRTVSLSETDDGRYVGTVRNDENGSVTATVTVTGENVTREATTTWSVVERQTVIQATNTNATTPAAARGGTVVSQFRLQIPAAAGTAGTAGVSDADGPGDGAETVDAREANFGAAARELARSDANLSTVTGIDDAVVAAARALRDRTNASERAETGDRTNASERAETGDWALPSALGPQAAGSGTTVVVGSSGLTGPNGTVIPARRITATPTVVSLSDGGTQNVSLRVRLPDAASPGLYRGHLELVVDGAVVETPVTVNVTTATKGTLLRRVEQASRQWQTAGNSGRDYYERRIADELTDAYFGADSNVSLPAARDGPTKLPARPSAAGGEDNSADTTRGDSADTTRGDSADTTRGDSADTAGVAARARAVTPVAVPRGGAA